MKKRVKDCTVEEMRRFCKVHDCKDCNLKVIHCVPNGYTTALKHVILNRVIEIPEEEEE